MVENKPHIVFGCLRCVFDDVVVILNGQFDDGTAVYKVRVEEIHLRLRGVRESHRYIPHPEARDKAQGQRLCL